MSSESKDDVVGLVLKEAERFDANFGRFMLLHSRVEGAVYRVLLKYSGVSDAVGRAILSGARMRPMIAAILAILENTKAPEHLASHLKFVLAQLNAINTARDELVHHAVPSYSLSGVEVSNATRVKRYANAESFKVTSEQLRAMTADLGAIETQLSFHQHPFQFEGPPFPLPSTWRYKSRQPKSSPRKKAQAGQKPLAQRPSSRR